MWFIYLKAMSLSLRAVLFEKYSLVVSAVWSTFFLILLVVLSGLHWSFALVVIVVSFGVYRLYFNFMMLQKYHLIFKGDCVEYTPLNDDETIVQSKLFKTTKVSRLMKQDEVKLSGGFESEYLEYYELFYLCEDKNKKLFIPFEWIIRIETELEV